MYTRYAPVGGCANNPLKPAKRLKNSRQHSQYKLAMVHCLISVREKKGLLFQIYADFRRRRPDKTPETDVDQVLLLLC